jgi:hypothetical protein
MPPRHQGFFVLYPIYSPGSCCDYNCVSAIPLCHGLAASFSSSRNSQFSILSIRLHCGSPLEEISMFAITPSTASFDDSRFMPCMYPDDARDEHDFGAPSIEGLIAIELDVEEIVL